MVEVDPRFYFITINPQPTKTEQIGREWIKTCVDEWQIGGHAGSTPADVFHAHYSFDVLWLRIRALRAIVRRR
jgi:hypothetical protein